MIQQYEYHGPKPWPTIVFLGAIHGNEICGPQAIHAIMRGLDTDIIPLTRGTVIFVPVCNPLAYTQDVRSIDENLNRVFKKHVNPRSYEAGIANELCEIVDRADYLLDIHSISSDGRPFVFQDYADTATKDFVSCLGIEYIVTGWPEMYETTNSSDTIGYGHARWIVGAVIECGNHHDRHAKEIARSAIMRALAHLDMTPALAITRAIPTSIVHATRIIHKKQAGAFTRIWNHLDMIERWTIIAQCADGSQICADDDGYILLPDAHAPVGAEWFYFWGAQPNAL